jgi:formate C-acetyltransferase
MYSKRIDFLKKQLFETKREISLERALLYTESYKSTEGEPVIIRRAKATAHILDNVAISIRENELITGNRTIKPRSGIVSPEMDPKWILSELDTIATRPQDQFYISEKDKEIYRNELCTYWSGKSLKDSIYSKLTDEIKTPVSMRIFALNQTDKGQGHIIMDLSQALNNGLDYILEKVEKYSEDNQDNDFYKAALITLLAAQRHIIRYAELAEEMIKQNLMSRERLSFLK